MVKGKLHTKIVALGYRKRNSKDITITEELVHIARDEDRIKTPHKGIHHDKTENNVILHGDYEEFISRFDKMDNLSPYERRKLTNDISRCKVAFEKAEKRLEDLLKENAPLSKIEQTQRTYEDNKNKFDELVKYRDTLKNNNAIDYYEIIMSISNAQHILTMSKEKQREYVSIFNEHLDDFMKRNPHFGIRKLAIGHLDQSNSHIHNINEIAGGWSELKSLYISNENRNPFPNMILDISADFKNKYSDRLKEFGIELEDNIDFKEQTNFTDIARLKTRTKKKEELLNDIKSFIQVPKSLSEVRDNDKERILSLAIEAVKERDEYLTTNAEKISYIDDKKHEVLILREQLKQIFYNLEPKELDMLEDSVSQDKYIQKRIENSRKKDKNRTEYLLSIQENFQKFIEYIKEQMSNLIHIKEPELRLKQFHDLSSSLDSKIKDISELTNNTLSSEIKFKDKTLEVIKEKSKVKTQEQDFSMIDR